MSGQADPSKVVYVISGASRGLGFGVVELLATRPNAIIYAGARDPAKSITLQQLAKTNSNVHIVKLSAESEADHKALAAQVEAEQGRADVVWANAGISPTSAWVPVQETSLTDLREHLEVNTVHPLMMYKAFYGLLDRSATAKFIVSSSAMGSTGQLDFLGQYLMTAYCVSKAGVNNPTRRIHFENSKIVAVPFHPGDTRTHVLQLHRQAYQQWDHTTSTASSMIDFCVFLLTCGCVAVSRLCADRHGH